MSPIKLVVFDLDGTLVDSIGELIAATNHVRTAFSLSPFSESDVRIMLGNGGKRLVEQALPEAGADELNRATAMYLAYGESHLLESTRLYPGVIEVVIALHEAGINMAILSNKHSSLSCKLLNLLGIDSYFSAIIGPDMLPCFKPSPYPVLKLLGDFGAAAGETVMVGDSFSDITCGKRAGVATVGCSYGYGHADELAEADYRIINISELLLLSLFGSSLKSVQGSRQGCVPHTVR